MIKILEMDDVHTLGFRVDGKLDRADVKRIFDSFEKSLREKEDIKIYMEIENTNLGDISAGAYKEDIKFWLRHPALLPYFRKAALVTDSAWIERIFAIECALIPTLEGEGFPFEEKDEALKWLRTDQRAESRMDITY
ncbi:MAG: STAS/SEC14 domain-containing protein, partial [Acidobacteria bacterium]|nr:STAS/SEC14 domain-containing protein [Acidobacteriota bacterium]